MDVFFALTGDPRRNSRALRQLRVLASEGASVRVLGFGAAAPSEETFPADLQLLRLPERGGPAFFLRVHRQVREVALSVPARVYHASDLYTLPALAAAARMHGAHLVYDARELYPHVASTAGRPWVSWFWRRVEGRYVGRADAVFTVSRRIAGHLADTYGLPAPTVLFNTPQRRTVERTDLLRTQVGLTPEQVLVLHQGQMRPGRGCGRLLEAVREVHEAVLVFLGDGPLQPSLRAQAEAAGIRDRVHFLPPVASESLLPVTASADIGVTLLEDTCLNHRYALPNKLFEYLMAGVPVLGSDLPEVREVVRGHEVGLVANPADHAALVAALRRMVRDAEARAAWAANAPRVFDTYDPDRGFAHFAALYRRLFSN